MMMNSCGTLRRGILLILTLLILAPGPFARAEVPSDCLDLAGYLAQLRAKPDSLYMHHQLMELTLRNMPPRPATSAKAILTQLEAEFVAEAAMPDPAPSASPSVPASAASPVSDLAAQRALDFFQHPDRITLGLAAAKHGTGFIHDFTAYQRECAKIVTGNIFAVEGMSVIWEIIAHNADHVTLKRLTSGGGGEISPDLKIVLKDIQVLAPTVPGQVALPSHHAPRLRRQSRRAARARNHAGFGGRNLYNR